MLPCAVVEAKPAQPVLFAQAAPKALFERSFLAFLANDEGLRRGEHHVPIVRSSWFASIR